MKTIFKACDIRGVYGRDLTEDVARRIGAAVATLLRRRGSPARVVVGGDVRLSTPALKAALLEGLSGCGAACDDVGTVPTPVFYFARRHLGVAAGVMVTASHNPAPHNGLKIILGDLPVTEADLREVRALAEAGTADRAPGSVAGTDVLPFYADFLLGATVAWHPPAGTAPLLVLDPGNGSWASVAARIVRAAGYRVAAINDVPDGRFPGRDPNPSVPAHLEALGRAVVERRAALGIAFDGDGDRVSFVDDRGRPVGADAAAALLVRGLVPAEAGARVVHDIKCSQMVADEVVRYGGVPTMERSGHTFIKTRVIGTGALLGAEASGHYFFRALDGGDDGLYCALLFASLALSAGRPLSDCVDALPHYATTPDIRVPFTKDIRPLLEAIASAFPVERVSRLDGVRVQFGEGWGLARLSVTEPAVTLRFEARTPEALAGIMDAFLAPAPELSLRVPRE